MQRPPAAEASSDAPPVEITTFPIRRSTARDSQAGQVGASPSSYSSIDASSEKDSEQSVQWYS